MGEPLPEPVAGAPPAPPAATPWPLPYLTALMIALGMFMGNIEWLVGLNLFQPFVLALLVAAVVDGLARLALRRSPTRSLGAAFLVLWVLGFGNFDLSIYQRLGSQAATTLVWSVLMLGGAALVWWRSDLPILRTFGGLMHICLWALVAIQTANLAYVLTPELRFEAAPLAVLPADTGAPPPPGPLPDIYYIIPDTYPRADVLARYYDLDNSAFLAALRARGFVVGERSRCNYNQTGLSLASSLNMSYLDQAALEGHRTRIPLRRLIATGRAIQEMQRHGYTTINVASGYSATEGLPLDEQASYPPDRRWWTLYPPADELQTHFYSCTIASALLQPALKQAHRDRVRHGLAVLPRLRQQRSGPVFVFAHLLLPHPPFLFGADGAAVDEHLRHISINDGVFVIPPGSTARAEYQRGYVRQVHFCNQLLLAAVDGILAASTRPVVIIIQADTGPASHGGMTTADTNLFERYGILNAIRAPEQALAVPADLTPVNTFRLVCDQYFGTAYGTLPNQCFHASYLTPYHFEDVTERTGPPAPASR